MAVIEVRDYHYDQERMDRYRTWAIEAGSYLRELWDMSGFWLDSGEAPRLTGSDPREHPHGAANVTWVIRWDSMAQRETAWDDLWKEPEWADIWSRHPGFDGYLQLSVRFLEEV